MTESKDKWQGRQFYPKDTVTRKQMDRQDDRQTRRIDLYKEKHNRLEQRVQQLEERMFSWRKVMEDADKE